MKPLSRAVLLTSCLFLAVSIAKAQQMVHAVSGTVTTIHPKIQMTDLETDDGSPGSFHWTKPGVAMNFDKTVSADTVTADKFTALQAHVIGFYYYEGDVRTLVAVRDVGAGPFVKSSGKILKLDRNEHLLTIFKFNYSKGVQVQVLATQANGSQTALLIAPII